MSGSSWKTLERIAARLFGGTRFPANSGGALDFESTTFVGQVKARRALSHAELSALCSELERIGFQKGKLGVVVTRCPQGRGTAMPVLIHCTERVWRELHGEDFYGWQ